MASSTEKNGLVEHFKEWACSFSGCDGGDLNSPVWLCGIEWGYSNSDGKTDEEYQEDMRIDYSQRLPAQIAQGAYEPTNLVYFEEKRWKFPYVRNVAKLYGALKGMNVEEVDRTKTSDWKIFHMNLYPIAFNNESDELWDTYKLAEVTGLESKQIYRTWCLLRRFPWIADQVREHKPKLVIGTGVGYLTDFIVCCGGSGIVDNIHKETIVGNPDKKETSTRTMYWTKVSDETTLVVTPFPSGRFGLNSNALLQKFGDRIRDVSGMGI